MGGSNCHKYLDLEQEKVKMRRKKSAGIVDMYCEHQFKIVPKYLFKKV